jgi:phosphatidylglycerophosphate synthase
MSLLTRLTERRRLIQSRRRIHANRVPPDAGEQKATMSDSAYRPTERRPIAARRWPIWQKVAVVLARSRVSPNAISVAGMIAGIAAGAALAATAFVADGSVGLRIAWLVAAAFIQLRLIANLLDGMVAIESGRASPLGELFNEVPDRVSDAAGLIGAGYALGGDPALGYLAACAALFTAYVRAMGKAAGAPQEYCGPMAKQHRMALLTAVAVYCGLAPAEWQPVCAECGNRGIVAVALGVIALGSLLTAGRRLVRIAANLRKTS